MLKMIFVNLSDTDLYSFWDIVPKKDGGLKSVKQSPAKIMQANGGKETLWVDQEFLSWYVDGNCGDSCFWRSEDWELLFGICMHAPLQFLGIGARPYWGVGLNESGTLTWTNKLADQSSPYTFPDLPGYKIVARPTSSHSSIVVTVTIENKV